VGLLLEADHLRGQFRGSAELREVDELPALDLCAVAEVEVLGEGILLPPAGIVDGGAAPHASRPVKVHEPPAAVSRGVFDDKVPVEEDRLTAGQDGGVAVQVVPADLHHSDLVIGEVRDDVLEDVARGDEVSVEDGNKLARRLRERLGQCASANAPAL